MGVSFNNVMQAWGAYIGNHAKRKHLGYYWTKEEAVTASEAGKILGSKIPRKGSLDYWKSREAFLALKAMLG